jgi:DNA-binding MarR family transcriptional regulator
MPTPAKARRRSAGSALPLSTLLSQAFTAFTIEFDNEFEHQMPHQTTRHAKTPGAPWLVSMVLWSSFMRFIPDEGISARDLLALTGLGKDALRMRLQRMARWWGYLIVTPAPSGEGWIVRPSPGGRQALRIWQPLAAEIEQRWQERFGREALDTLRHSLSAILAKTGAGLPGYLPILGAVWDGWFAKSTLPRETQAESGVARPVSELLAQVLLAFTLDFEKESLLSLAIYSDMIRVLDDAGVPIRNLPRLTGVSKEAIKMMLGYLGKIGLIVTEEDPQAARVKQVRLTDKGLVAQDYCRHRLPLIEEQWQEQFGTETIQSLRQALEQIVGNPALHQGLKLHPEGWRASLSGPETLPHYPLVLHRGGFPDGS